MPRYSATQYIGINAVEGIVLKEIGWIFRQQPVVDMGIDAHIELVTIDGRPTGKLIAAQIKTGAGNLRETKHAYVFYGDKTHLDYWLGHSLPVVLIAHLPETGETLWSAVNKDSIAHTKTGWKILIPKTRQLNADARDALAGLFDGPPSQQRLRTLSIHLPLMRHIRNGGKVSVELEDWVNKSLGRTPVKVLVEDDQGNEDLSLEWYQYYTGYRTRQLAEVLFPWASASVDHDFYDLHADEEDPHDAFLRALDEDNAVVTRERHSDDVYPYSSMSGEVEYYRLRLDLNPLGDAFLVVSDYSDQERTTVAQANP